MGKQEGESRWWAKSSSSTVLLDPAAFVETWKRQIQGKDGIPAQQQRLTFACRTSSQEEEGRLLSCHGNTYGGSQEGRGSGDLIKDLQTWQAILRCNETIVAKLLHPVVLGENEQLASRLYCRTARELREIGIPCDVFYLSFDKWVPAAWQLGAPPELTSKCSKNPVQLSLEVDKSFQYSNYRIDLFGRLEGSRLPEFVYRMNGGEVHTQLSMLQQTAQYRQGHQLRHRLALRSHTLGKGVVGRDAHFCADIDGPVNSLCLTHDHSDHFIPCGKDLEFTAVVSKDTSHLKCLVLTVITVPVDTQRRLEQLVSPGPPFQQFRDGRAEAPNATTKEAEVFCLSTSPLTANYSTNKAGYSNQRTPLDRSNIRRSLCDHISLLQSVEQTVDNPLLQFKERCHGRPTSTEPGTSSSCGDSRAEAKPMTEQCEVDSLLLFTKDSVKQSKKKKKKKKKGKRSSARAVQYSAETFTKLDIARPSDQAAALEVQCSSPLPVPVEDGEVGMSDFYPSPCETCTNVCLEDGLHTCQTGKDSAVTEKAWRREKNGEVSDTNVGEGSHTDLNSRERPHSGPSSAKNPSGSGGQQRYTRDSRQTWKRRSPDSRIDLQGPLAEVGGGCSWQGNQSKFGATEDAGDLGGSFDSATQRARLTVGSAFNGCSGMLEAKIGGNYVVTNGLEQAAAYCKNTGRFAPLEFLMTIDQAEGRSGSSFMGVHEVDTWQPKPLTELALSSKGECKSMNSSGGVSKAPPCMELQRSSETARDTRNSAQGVGSAGGRNGCAGSPDINGNMGYGKGYDDQRRTSGGGYPGRNAQGSGSRATPGNGPEGEVMSRGLGGAGKDSDFGLVGATGRGGGGGNNAWGGGDGHRREHETDNGNHPLQRRKPSGSALEHRGRRVVVGETLLHGSGGSSFGTAVQTLGSAAGGKENIHTFWQKKHKDEPPVCDTGRQRSGNSGEGDMDGELYSQAPCHNETNEGNNSAGPLRSQSAASVADSNGNSVLEGPFSSQIKVANFDRSSKEVDQHSNQISSRQTSVANATGFKAEQNHGSCAEVICTSMASNPSDNVATFQYQRKDSAAPLSVSDEHQGLNMGPLTVHFPPSPIIAKETQALDVVVSASRSPSTPHGYKEESHVPELGQLSTSLQPMDHPLGDVVVSIRAGATEVVPSLEEVSQRLKGCKRAIGDQERRWGGERGGGEKEHLPLHTSLRKWVRRPSAEGQVPAVSSGCNYSKEREELACPLDQVDCGACIINGQIKTQAICPHREGVSSREGEIVPDDISKGLCSEVKYEIMSPKSLRLLQTCPVTAKDNNLPYKESPEPTPGVLETLLLVPADELDTPKLRYESGNGGGINSVHEVNARMEIMLQGCIEKGAGGLATVGLGRSRTSNDKKSEIGPSWRQTNLRPETLLIDEETQSRALLLMAAIQASRDGREASAQVACAIGTPLAELERVLYAVAPTVGPSPNAHQEGGKFLRQHSTCDCATSKGWKDDGSQGVCCCQLADVSLSAIWQWYEEPSNCGVEVRAPDFQRNGVVGSSFLAYFVPYLSGIQLFGCMGPVTCHCDRVWQHLDVQASCDLGQGDVIGSKMLTTLLPPDSFAGSAREGVSHMSSDKSGKSSHHSSPHLLYEFFEHDQPPHRRPLLQKIGELLKGESKPSGLSSGDPAVLSRVRLRDLHPASWFAVAWYPIYRIPDGPLRSVFLTYHSLHHCVSSSSLSHGLGCSDDSSDGYLSFPVVGLECYNTQFERWLSMGIPKEAAVSTRGETDRPGINPDQIWKERLHSLQAVAEAMARGMASNAGRSKLADYEFFVSRRR